MVLRGVLPSLSRDGSLEEVYVQSERERVAVVTCMRVSCITLKSGVLKSLLDRRPSLLFTAGYFVRAAATRERESVSEYHHVLSIHAAFSRHYSAADVPLF